MTTHKYRSSDQLPSRVHGSLSYDDGDVPVLLLTGDTPFDDGYAHGYLCGEQIAASMRSFDTVMRTTNIFPRANQVPDVVANIVTNLQQANPAIYEELYGLSRGFNRRMLELGADDRMATEDALMMHLIPDSKHLHPFCLQSTIPSPACTCVVLQAHDQASVTFGRNLDWISFGVSGENSVLIVWKRLGIASFTVPGLIGIVTGWNNSGLCMAMNVCPGKTNEISPLTLPAIFNNRILLESCTNVAETRWHVERRTVSPIGPYHLTLADPKGHAACISFRQNPDGTDHVRVAKPGEPLTVVNWRYPECAGGTFNSEERMCLLQDHFRYDDGAHPSNAKTVERAMRLPLVNSWITLQSFVFEPTLMRVHMSWNNSFAADGPLHAMRLDQYF